MLWHIISIVTLFVAAWSAWGTWQNTQAIKSILKMTDDFNDILQKIIEHTKMQ